MYDSIEPTAAPCTLSPSLSTSAHSYNAPAPPVLPPPVPAPYAEISL
nr:MAG TPA: hypothetical protein [Caudoviricetes sp.]